MSNEGPTRADLERIYDMLIGLKATLDPVLARLEGYVTRLGEHEARLEDHEGRLRSLERRRWRLPVSFAVALAVLVALVALNFFI